MLPSAPRPKPAPLKELPDPPEPPRQPKPQPLAGRWLASHQRTACCEGPAGAGSICHRRMMLLLRPTFRHSQRRGWHRIHTCCCCCSGGSACGCLNEISLCDARCVIHRSACYAKLVGDVSLSTASVAVVSTSVLILCHQMPCLILCLGQPGT